MGLKEFAEEARAEAIRLEGLTSSAKFKGGIPEVRALHDLAGALKDFAKGAGKVQSAADGYAELMSEDVCDAIARKADGFPIVVDILGLDPEPILPGTDEAAMLGADDKPPAGDQKPGGSRAGDSTEGGEAGDESKGDDADTPETGKAAPEGEGESKE